MRPARAIVVGVVAGLLYLAIPAAPADAQWWKLAWTVDVKVTRPQRVTVETPGIGPVLYTYLTYEITNRTLRDVDLVPLVTLVTDTGATSTTYNDELQPDVKAVVERREKAKFLSGSEMMGVLKVGESRRGLVIFRNVDLKAKVWDIYVGGLSGEYVLQLIPGQAEPLILHKTFHAQYRNRGDEFEPQDWEIEFVNEEWTYR